MPSAIHLHDGTHEMKIRPLTEEDGTRFKAHYRALDALAARYRDDRNALLEAVAPDEDGGITTEEGVRCIGALHDRLTAIATVLHCAPGDILARVEALHEFAAVSDGDAAASAPPVRPIVRAFAGEMERKLAKGDYRGGWTPGDIEYVWRELHEHLGKLSYRLYAGDGTLLSDAADVANLAMILADLLGGERVA